MPSKSLRRQLLKPSILLVIVIAGIAIVLSVISYQFSSTAADEILKLASTNARSNAEVQAHDLANVLVNKVDVVSSSLQIMSAASPIQNLDIPAAISIFSGAHNSTTNF